MRPDILEIFQTDISAFMKPNPYISVDQGDFYHQTPLLEKQFLIFQEVSRIFGKIMAQLREKLTGPLYFHQEIHSSNIVAFNYTQLIGLVVKKNLDQLGIEVELTEKSENLGRMLTIIFPHRLKDSSSIRGLIGFHCRDTKKSSC